MITIQRRIAVVVAILLALSVAYYVGKKQGEVGNGFANLSMRVHAGS